MKDQSKKDITEKIIETFKTKPDKDIPTDIQGSYTGVPLNGKFPVQDADDL